MSNRSKITAILAITLLTLFSAGLFAGAKLKFQDITYNFGEEESGKVIDILFEFVNEGDETLIIKNIMPDCACTAHQLQKKEYEPGEKGVIPVKFISQGIKGRVMKKIIVASNDKEEPFIHLKIEGVLKLTNYATAVFSPGRVDFGEVKNGEPVSRKITLKNTGTINLKVIDILHAPESYLIFGKTVIPPGQETEIEIVLKPEQVGTYLKFIKIRTTDMKQKTMLLRINAEVK